MSYDQSVFKNSFMPAANRLARIHTNLNRKCSIFVCADITTGRASFQTQLKEDSHEVKRSVQLDFNQTLMLHVAVCQPKF